MTHKIGDTWQHGDPLPPIGATLQTSGGRDYVTIRRTGYADWEWAVNNHRYEPCTAETLLWAAVGDLKITELITDKPR